VEKGVVNIMLSETSLKFRTILTLYHLPYQHVGIEDITGCLSFVAIVSSL